MEGRHNYFEDPMLSGRDIRKTKYHHLKLFSTIKKGRDNKYLLLHVKVKGILSNVNTGNDYIRFLQESSPFILAITHFKKSFNIHNW